MTGIFIHHFFQRWGIWDPCFVVLTKPLELMELYLPNHGDKFQSNLPRATETKWAGSLLCVCLLLRARGWFAIGNSKAIILTDISSPLPMCLRFGEREVCKAHLALTAGPGLGLLLGTDGFECKAHPDPQLLPILSGQEICFDCYFWYWKISVWPLEMSCVFVSADETMG